MMMMMILILEIDLRTSCMPCATELYPQLDITILPVLQMRKLTVKENNLSKAILLINSRAGIQRQSDFRI